MCICGLQVGQPALVRSRTRGIRLASIKRVNVHFLIFCLLSGPDASKAVIYFLFGILPLGPVNGQRLSQQIRKRREASRKFWRIPFLTIQRERERPHHLHGKHKMIFQGHPPILENGWPGKQSAKKDIVGPAVQPRNNHMAGSGEQGSPKAGQGPPSANQHASLKQSASIGGPSRTADMIETIWWVVLEFCSGGFVMCLGPWS